MTSMASERKLARVARGGRVGFADYPPQIWLLLAGSLLVRALGTRGPQMVPMTTFVVGLIGAALTRHLQESQ